jgi:hypothetical protein
MKVGSDPKESSMATTNGDKDIGLTLAAAGAGIMGASVVFGLTTDSGAIDWIGIITAVGGLTVVLTGLFRAYRPGTPHTD